MKWANPWWRESLLEDCQGYHGRGPEEGREILSAGGLRGGRQTGPNPAETKITPVQEVPQDWLIVDIGPATVTLFGEALQNAKTIIWNGPMGAFEYDAFSRGTMAMVQKVADSYALTIVGGGDTDVALHKAGEFQKFSYVSTGGGAFIELLEGKKLPGITALEKWAKGHPDV